MTHRLSHPLRAHLPALAVVIFFLAALLQSPPLPKEMPLHFNLHGLADSYGPSWVFLAVVFGFSCFFIALSVSSPFRY